MSHYAFDHIEWTKVASSTLWDELADLKESNPVEVTGYAITGRNDHEPVSACWWVQHSLHCCNRIIEAVSNQYNHKRTHKFGIETPRTSANCVRKNDNSNSNTLWQDAVWKIMSKVDDGAELPPTYQEICYHLIFDGHMNASPPPLGSNICMYLL